MSRDLISSLFLLFFGGFLAVHCCLAARRELRAGVARGRYQGYVRDVQPIGFWTIIAADLIASLLGLGSFLIGLAWLTIAL